MAAQRFRHTAAGRLLLRLRLISEGVIVCVSKGRADTFCCVFRDRARWDNGLWCSRCELPFEQPPGRKLGLTHGRGVRGAESDQGDRQLTKPKGGQVCREESQRGAEVVTWGRS